MNICYKNPRFIKEFDALVKQHSLSECVLNEIANDDDPSECATDYYAEYDTRIHTRKKLEVVSSMEVLLDFLNFETLKEFCKEIVDKRDNDIEDSAWELMNDYMTTSYGFQGLCFMSDLEKNKVKFQH